MLQRSCTADAARDLTEAGAYGPDSGQDLAPLKAAVRAHPLCAEGHLLLGEKLLGQGQRPPAMSHAVAAMGLAPHRAPLIARGSVLLAPFLELKAAFELMEQVTKQWSGYLQAQRQFITVRLQQFPDLCFLLHNLYSIEQEYPGTGWVRSSLESLNWERESETGRLTLSLLEQKMTYYLTKIVAHLEQGGAKVLLLNYPRYMADPCRGWSIAAISRLARKRGLATLRLDTLLDPGKESLLRKAWFAKGGHVNREGYEQIAKGVFRKLARLLREGE